MHGIQWRERALDMHLGLLEKPLFLVLCAHELLFLSAFLGTAEALGSSLRGDSCLGGRGAVYSLYCWHYLKLLLQSLPFIFRSTIILISRIFAKD